MMARHALTGAVAITLLPPEPLAGLPHMSLPLPTRGTRESDPDHGEEKPRS